MISFAALHGRTSGIAFIEGSYLVFKSDVDGSRMSLALMNLEMSIKGENSQHYYFFDKFSPRNEICIQDVRLVSLLADRNIPGAKKILKKSKFQKLKRSLFLGSPLAIILVMLIALPFMLTLIPVSWIASLLTPQQEKSFGKWLFPIVRAEYQIKDNHPAQPILREVLDQLEKANPGLKALGIEIFISTSDQVNAFAAPGNYIVMNKGIILNASSIEEVIGVIAHEVGHIEQRHVFKSVVGGVGSLLATAGLGAMLGLDAALRLTRVTHFLELKYSRDDEIAADKRGFQFLSNAEISAKGFINFFSKLAQSESNISSLFTFASTHPASAERVNNLNKMSSQNSNSFLERSPAELFELKSVF